MFSFRVFEQNFLFNFLMIKSIWNKTALFKNLPLSPASFNCIYKNWKCIRYVTLTKNMIIFSLIQPHSNLACSSHNLNDQNFQRKTSSYSYFRMKNCEEQISVKKNFGTHLNSWVKTKLKSFFWNMTQFCVNMFLSKPIFKLISHNSLYLFIFGTIYFKWHKTTNGKCHLLHIKV